MATKLKRLQHGIRSRWNKFLAGLIPVLISTLQYLPPLSLIRQIASSTGGGSVTNRRNASSTGWCQRQGLVFDAKCEYMMKLLSTTRGCQVCIIDRGDVNDKGGYNTGAGERLKRSLWARRRHAQTESPMAPARNRRPRSPKRPYMAMLLVPSFDAVVSPESCMG